MHQFVCESLAVWFDNNTIQLMRFLARNKSEIQKNDCFSNFQDGLLIKRSRKNIEVLKTPKGLLVSKRSVCRSFISA